MKSARSTRMGRSARSKQTAQAAALLDHNACGDRPWALQADRLPNQPFELLLACAMARAI
jgi:hypothetical protein